MPSSCCPIIIDFMKRSCVLLEHERLQCFSSHTRDFVPTPLLHWTLSFWPYPSCTPPQKRYDVMVKKNRLLKLSPAHRSLPAPIPIPACLKPQPGPTDWTSTRFLRFTLKHPGSREAWLPGYRLSMGQALWMRLGNKQLLRFAAKQLQDMCTFKYFQDIHRWICCMLQRNGSSAYELLMLVMVIFWSKAWAQVKQEWRPNLVPQAAIPADVPPLIATMWVGFVA